MKRVLAAGIILCLLGACARPDAEPSPRIRDFVQDQVWQETAVTEVSLDPQEIPAGKNAEDVLHDRGLEKGVKNVLNRWLVQRLLFAESRSGLGKWRSVPYVRIDRGVQAVQDQVTNMYTQTFRVKARFAPCREARGTIFDLENDRTMVSTRDQVLIRGTRWLARDEGAFFLVARPVPEMDNTYRIIGSGRIFHVLRDVAQGRLLETNREIKTGDLVYPIWVSSQGVQTPNPSPEKQEKMDEVVVQPRPEPKPEWTPPAEPK